MKTKHLNYAMFEKPRSLEMISIFARYFCGKSTQRRFRREIFDAGVSGQGVFGPHLVISDKLLTVERFERRLVLDVCQVHAAAVPLLSRANWIGFLINIKICTSIGTKGIVRGIDARASINFFRTSDFPSSRNDDNPCAGTHPCVCVCAFFCARHTSPLGVVGFPPGFRIIRALVFFPWKLEKPQRKMCFLLDK